jgi:uncharacterized protein (TIGR00106 family)
MSLVAELSLFPLDKGQSVGEYVARAVAVIRESGLPHQLTPMGTCIEGEWSEVMGVVRRCFEVIAADSDRVYLTIKIDWRRGRTNGLQTKTESVERALAGEAGA